MNGHVGRTQTPKEVTKCKHITKLSLEINCRHLTSNRYLIMLNQSSTHIIQNWALWHQYFLIVRWHCTELFMAQTGGRVTWCIRQEYRHIWTSFINLNHIYSNVIAELLHWFLCSILSSESEQGWLTVESKSVQIPRMAENYGEETHWRFPIIHQQLPILNFCLLQQSWLVANVCSIMGSLQVCMGRKKLQVSEVITSKLIYEMVLLKVMFHCI